MLRAVDAAMTNVRSEGLIVRVENKISTLAKERNEAANNGKYETAYKKQIEIETLYWVERLIREH